jgi:hypothetical protein
MAHVNLKGVESKKKTKSAPQIKLNFRLAPKTPSLTAQHMIIQDVGDFIQLSFFEIAFPLMSDDATPEQIELLSEAGINAECVARINVPASRFNDFVDAINGVVPKRK